MRTSPLLLLSTSTIVSINDEKHEKSKMLWKSSIQRFSSCAAVSYVLVVAAANRTFRTINKVIKRVERYRVKIRSRPYWEYRILKHATVGFTQQQLNIGQQR